MKKIFKAILAISIIGAMALGFAACGGNGGSDAIAVISREEGSGTRGAFVELTGVEVDKVDKTVATAEISSSTAVVMQTVAGSNSYKTDRLFDINRSVVISRSFGSSLVGSLALSVMLCPFVLITHVFYF